VSELGHALGEAGLRAEAQVGGGRCWGGHDVPDVPEPVLPGHDRFDADALPISPTVCGSPLATL